MAEFISVSEAQRLIRESITVLPEGDLSLIDGREGLSREALFADRNLPPFHRVSMDGVSFSFAAWEAGARTFPVEAFQGAGEPSKVLNDKGSCIEVMTGAVLPQGCDCVVRFEDLIMEGGVASLLDGVSVKRMQNVHQEGADYRKGDCLLSEGCWLRAPQYAVAASVGKSTVRVSQAPRVALVSTGNELVAVEDNPDGHQIRRSNSYAILSALKSVGVTDVSLFHLRDDKAEMSEKLKIVLQDFDVLVLTGGVSMGKMDFVPEILQDSGVRKVFHKVRQRPGKPLWFGVGERQQLVFGLPGNPVAALICFHRYVLPALKLSYSAKGKSSSENQPYGILSEKFIHHTPLTNFLPVQVEYANDGRTFVTPKKVNGSGDFVSLSGSHGFIEIDAGEERGAEGAAHPLWFWNRW